MNYPPTDYAKQGRYVWLAGDAVAHQRHERAVGYLSQRELEHELVPDCLSGKTSPFQEVETGILSKQTVMEKQQEYEAATELAIQMYRCILGEF